MDESEKEEALDYIYQLINIQFLVSELDAQVTGNNEWERVFAILNKIPSFKKQHLLLKKCKEQIELLDNKVIPDQKIYLQIKKIVDEIECVYEDKYLFQTDLNTTTVCNELGFINVLKSASSVAGFSTVNNLSYNLTSACLA